MFVYRVLETFAQKKVKFAIAGGWAVALHGAVRGTVDLDVVVVLTEANMGKTEAALNKLGLQSRPPLHAKEVVQFREEYIKNRKMFAWRFFNPTNPAEVVDVLISEDLRDLKVKVVHAGPKKMPIVALADLIHMKKRSGRPQDLEDIKALEKLTK